MEERSGTHTVNGLRFYYPAWRDANKILYEWSLAVISLKVWITVTPHLPKSIKMYIYIYININWHPETQFIQFSSRQRAILPRLSLLYFPRIFYTREKLSWHFLREFRTFDRRTFEFDMFVMLYGIISYAVKDRNRVNQFNFVANVRIDVIYISIHLAFSNSHTFTPRHLVAFHLLRFYPSASTGFLLFFFVSFIHTVISARRSRLIDPRIRSLNFPLVKGWRQ